MPTTTVTKPARLTRTPRHLAAARSQRGFLRFFTSWFTPLVALVLYLAFWPTPVSPVSWQAPANMGYSGAHAANTKLAGLSTWPLGEGQEGPEHIATFRGALYTALGNGDIVRLGEGGRAMTLVNTGGRPLGLEITPSGQMYIADAIKGLLGVNLLAPKLEVKTLITGIDWPLPNDPIGFANSVAIDASGNVWLTDASRRFSPKDHGGTFEASVLDMLEHSCTGRLLVMDPITLRKRVALSGLCFPNGLAFSQDGKHLFLSETATYRILQIDLARLSVTRSSQGLSSVPSIKNAFDQSAVRVLIDNLPGYPDNLMRGENGRIWVGLTKPRTEVLDFGADKPWLRSLTLRLPRALWPIPKPYGHLVAFDENGRVLDDLQDPSGAYPETTSATEMGGKLYVHSLSARSVGWMPYPTAPAVSP